MPSLDRGNIRVSWPDHPAFVLKFLSVKDFEAAVAIDRSLPAREFTVRLLHQQLLEPQMDIEAFRALPDPVLRRLAQRWEKAFLKGAEESLPKNLSVFARFKRVFLSYADAQMEKLRRTTQEFANSFATQLAPIRAQFAGIKISSQLLGLDALAYRHLTAITPLLSEVGSTLAQYRLPATLVSDAAKVLSDSIAQSVAVTGQVNAITKLSLEVSSAVRIQSAWMSESLSRVAEIARVVETHQGVLNRVHEVISAGLLVPPALAAFQRDILAQIEMANSLSTTLRAELIVPAQTTSILLGTIRQTSEREAGTTVSSEIVRPTERQVHSTRLAIQLGAVNAHFAGQWEGAWLSVSSDNPDRLRQAAHSGREVLRQLLEHLAPDHMFTEQEIRQQGHNGQVTRKMRVARILGLRLGSSQVTFIELVAKAIDVLYGRLSADAHDQTGAVSESEIIGLLMTLDGLLVLILGTD